MGIYDGHSLRIRELHEEGIKLEESLWTLLDDWPIGEYSNRLPYEDRADSDRARVNEVVLQIERWINALGIEVLPNTVHGKSKLKGILKAIEQIVLVEECKQVSKDEGMQVMKEALSFVLSVPLATRNSHLGWGKSITTMSDTAIILMEMDETKPELLDVYDAIKEVCSRFGIEAYRADDILHQVRITDVVNQYIANSEFVIADLTSLSSNVLYEVGYADALNRRPILFRKHGTELPFCLSLHNVPEYKTLGDLKRLLHDRLEAIPGRKVA